MAGEAENVAEQVCCGDGAGALVEAGAVAGTWPAGASRLGQLPGLRRDGSVTAVIEV